MAATFDDRKRKWWEWHKCNPRVWEYFEKFALEIVRRKGKQARISHWLLINRIRWEVYLETTGDEFKISNDFIAFYARYWRAKYPEFKELFQIKRMQGETVEGDDRKRCEECGMAIMLVPHKTTGNIAPIEAAPNPNGNIFISGGTYRIINEEEREIARIEDIPVYINHYANCSYKKDKQ